MLSRYPGPEKYLRHLPDVRKQIKSFAELQLNIYNLQEALPVNFLLFRKQAGLKKDRII